MSSKLAKTSHDSSVSGSKCEKNYDWDDDFGWDHHFGMDATNNAGEPYSNKGRSELVWTSLTGYGFQRTSDNKFDGKTPSACFEHFVRNQVKDTDNLLESGEIVGKEVSTLAKWIRNSEQISYLDDETKSTIAEMKDKDLVLCAISNEGFEGDDLYVDLFYSFCCDHLEQGTCTWHCRVCKMCQDWREWHCKGCNTCKYGVSIPCDKCNAREYASYKEHYFY